MWENEENLQPSVAFLNGWQEVAISMEDNNKDGKTNWIVPF